MPRTQTCDGDNVNISSAAAASIRSTGVSALACLSLLTFADSSSAQQEPFVAISARINPVMEPRGLDDAIAACQQLALCRNAVATAAVTVGLDPTLVAVGMAELGKLSRQPRSEEGSYEIWLPAPYLFCRATVETTSVVPSKGARGSILQVKSIDEGLWVYTWTPKQTYGEGRSWVDAVATVVGVLPEYRQDAIGKRLCNPPGQLFMNCRGAFGGGDRQPCGKSSG